MTRLHEGVLFLYRKHHPGEPIHLPLDLTPAPVLNVTAPVERKKELTGKAFECLRLLAVDAINGMTGVDGYILENFAGRRFGARLGELRPFLATLAGREFVPLRKGRPSINNPVAVEIGAGGDGIYRLEPWAVEVAREAVMAYDRSRNISAQAS